MSIKRKAINQALRLSQISSDSDIPVYIVVSKEYNPSGTQTDWHCETETIEEIEANYGETLFCIFTIKNIRSLNEIGNPARTIRQLKNTLKKEGYRTKRITEERLLKKQKKLRQILKEWKNEGILLYGDYTELLKKVKVIYEPQKPKFKKLEKLRAKIQYDADRFSVGDYV